MMNTKDIELVIATLEDAISAFDGTGIFFPQKHVENMHKSVAIMKRELKASKSRDKLDEIVKPLSQREQDRMPGLVTILPGPAIGMRATGHLNEDGTWTGLDIMGYSLINPDDKA